MDTREYFRGFSRYCLAQGTSIDYSMDLARRVFEQEGIFNAASMPMESSGVPIGVSLEDITTIVFSSGRKTEFAQNRAYRFLRDFTIDYLEGYPEIIQEFFPNGTPARERPLRSLTSRSIGTRETHTTIADSRDAKNRAGIR